MRRNTEWFSKNISSYSARNHFITSEFFCIRRETSIITTDGGQVYLCLIDVSLRMQGKGSVYKIYSTKRDSESTYQHP